MNIGLVLSGGMAKGAFQLGALKALQNFIPNGKIKYISCASVGVLNGYSYATGKLDHMEALWGGICGGDQKRFVGNVLKSDVLQQSIKSLYSPDDNRDFKLYTTLFNTEQNNLAYVNLSAIDKDAIPVYLKASVAMPVYNHAVNIGDISYYDGAMVDNIPVYPLLKQDLDYIICIYFDDVCYKFENAEFDSKIIKLTFPAEGAVRQSLVFKPDSIQKMLKDGYDISENILAQVFKNGYEDLEYIYKEIQRSSVKTPEKSLRVTGDVLVTNLNKVAQKFAKKRILL